ncbi:MAG: 16S rRNA (cytosine(1402)-N(4))-methyltransferase RsmH [Spirochaetia bacterium]|uniref:16S rRNA (cytosine(1402)-N(4))-methyltransferase RsmH n=1 Tax=Treponema berlinense TaxID=225004 RepID=UPI0026EC66C5|nr:16S rRNA (cytosine(1402)-N(4))-methyltransferase RsmH [Treponema berlinense]MDD5789907.1 16S rRNA (cytosine(1402)-N(4))-methyltransferase RsmH [Spirochaetia bacterium]
MEIVHTPVLLQECLDYLSPAGEPFEKHALMIDSTLGEGGHSFAFLSKFPGLSIIGLDADKNIQARARERLAPFGERMNFFNGWFNDFYENYDKTGRRPDLILFDLGISVYHYEKSGRGFSFRQDEPLDMRLNASEGESAGDIVNGWKEEALANMIYLYSDEKMSRRIARAIVEARTAGKITSSKALADLIWDAVPASYRYGQIHPATRTFQALRIAVNSELRRLPLALHSAFNVLNEGGKMGVITFHSLEDRIVKNYFRNLGKQCVCPPQQAVCSCGGRPCAEVLTRKPVEPTSEEVKSNSPSRSAKLRVVRKLRDAANQHFLAIEGEAM